MKVCMELKFDRKCIKIEMKFEKRHLLCVCYVFTAFLRFWRPFGRLSIIFDRISAPYKLSKFEMERRFLLRALVSSPFGGHNNVKLVERKMVNEVCCLYHELMKESNGRVTESNAKNNKQLKCRTL